MTKRDVANKTQYETNVPWQGVKPRRWHPCDCNLTRQCHVWISPLVPFWNKLCSNLTGLEHLYNFTPATGLNCIQSHTADTTEVAMFSAAVIHHWSVFRNYSKVHLCEVLWTTVTLHRSTWIDISGTILAQCSIDTALAHKPSAAGEPAAGRLTVQWGWSDFPLLLTVLEYRGDSWS